MHPDLVHSSERFKTEMDAVDETAHVLLKGHLLLEEALTAILDQYAFHREHVVDARLTFAQKVQLARAFCLRKNTLGEWELVSAINALRNDFAHRLSSTARSAKLARVKEVYFREAAGYKEIEKVKNEADAVVLLNACAHCAGFLSTYLADSRAYRLIVHAADRQLHPEARPFDL